MTSKTEGDSRKRVNWTEQADEAFDKIRRGGIRLRYSGINKDMHGMWVTKPPDSYTDRIDLISPFDHPGSVSSISVKHLLELMGVYEHGWTLDYEPDAAA